MAGNLSDGAATPVVLSPGAGLKSAFAVLLNMKNDAKRRKKFTEAQLAQTAFLKPGDVLELEIRSLDGSIDLGKQRNEIQDAQIFTQIESTG